MYEIRQAREEDREEVAAFMAREFKAIGTWEDEWMHYYEYYWNRPDFGEFAFVASIDDTIVGDWAFHVNDGMNSIRGRPVKFAGVSAVATDARHRRKGIMRAMCKEAFRVMNDMGIVLSILEPSPYRVSQMAYERVGYALAERRMKYEFAPDELRDVTTAEGVVARELTSPQESSEISKLERSMSRYGSRVYTWPQIHSRMVEDGGFWLIESEGGAMGCVRILPSEEGNVTVSNVYFNDELALMAIVDLVGKESAEQKEVSWIGDDHVPLTAFARNINGFKPESIGSMMMRVVSFAGYCESISYPDDIEVEIHLRLDDPECPWNSGVYELELSDGAMDLETRGDDTEYEVALTPHQLSLIIGGLYAPSVLGRYGLLECSQESASKLGKIFTPDSFTTDFRW